MRNPALLDASGTRVTLDHPALNVSTHAGHLSARYVQINTHDVINLLIGEGFHVAEAKVDRARRRDPRFVRHQVDFRHPNMLRDAPSGLTPRILFTNSHNGTTRAGIALGAFRQICSNGLVVGSVWAGERAVHAGDTARTLIDRIRALAANTAPLFGQIERWSRRELTPGQQLDFAKAAAELRFGDAQRFPPADLLAVRRAEDEGADLWRVFNRVQENTTRGGLSGRSTNGRIIHDRALTGIGLSTRYNAELWALAEQLA